MLKSYLSFQHILIKAVVVLHTPSKPGDSLQVDCVQIWRLSVLGKTPQSLTKKKNNSKFSYSDEHYKIIIHNNQ